MPDTITHLLFAESILGKLDKDTDRRAFYLGCLGPDPLFYYRLLCRSQNRDSVKAASRMHGLPGYLPINEIRRYIDNRASEAERPLLSSYLEGFISHYILDSCAHPYINRVSDGYPNGHKRFEMNIDALLLMDIKGEEAKYFDFRDYIETGGRSLDMLSMMFSRIFGRFCPDGIDERRYKASVRHMVKVCDIFRDRFGVFRKLFGLYEQLARKKDHFVYLFYRIPEDGAPDYMNKSGTNYVKSFREIFDDALDTFFRAGENTGSEYFQNDFSGRPVV